MKIPFNFPLLSESEIIDIQLLASFLSIISTTINFILLYNQKLIEDEKEPFLSREMTLKLLTLNRIFILIIVLIFLSSNYLHYKLDKAENKDLTFDYLDILSSILTLTVAGIAIYTAVKALEREDLSIVTSVDEA